MIRKVLLGVFALFALLFFFGPYEPVDTDVSFDPRKFGEGVQVYLESVESQFDDIRPDSEKRVIWAGAQETKTPVSLVYFHGFSASSQEIRPVPDQLAEALGANLVYTRFRGHGRTGDAMAEGSVKAWMEDAAEALAVGRAVGEKVIILSASTGSTIATVALHDPEMSKDVAGIVMVSPNFGIQNAMAPMLTFPAARYWLPLVAGERRSFEPQNPRQGEEWTTEYPSVAVFPMAAIVKHARGLEHEEVDVPALFYYSNEDKVVRADLTAAVEAKWGGETTRVSPQLTETDDSFAHVVTGDIMSPSTTETAVAQMKAWIEGLE